MRAESRASNSADMLFSLARATLGPRGEFAAAGNVALRGGGTKCKLGGKYVEPDCMSPFCIAPIST